MLVLRLYLPSSDPCRNSARHAQQAISASSKY